MTVGDRIDEDGAVTPALRNGALLAGAMIVAALIVFLIVQAIASNRQRDHALERERHSYDVMLLTRSVEASMTRAEATLGRFATSGDRDMGTGYYNAWVEAGTSIDKLQSLVGQDEEETQLVHQLHRLYSERGTELDPVATRAYYKQGWPALTLFNDAGHSKRIVDIRRTLDAIADHESAILQDRYDESDAAAVQADQTIRLLSVVGVALVGAALVLGWVAIGAIHRQRSAREDAEAADERAAWLEQAVAEQTRALSEANERLHEAAAERAVAEAQLRQMQKMEAVGQLTGGIAHDFNNMLAVVLGGLELAQRSLDSDPATARRHIDSAAEGADRAAALTRRLLGFARAEPLLPEAVHPATMIADMSALFDRTLGERILVETRVAADAWPVWVDPLQLENALLNLAVNARDAMDGSGRLQILVDNRTLRAAEIGEAPAGDYVRIAVVDNGCGMTPEVKERVFEPFFTTKPVGKGTGLGLSQIFGFVRQSHGEIAIDTALGRGTTVSLYLPRGRRIAAPAPRVAEPEPLPVAPRTLMPLGTVAAEPEPVLIVEDDPRVRLSTVAAVEELGYAPIACDNGEEALTLLAGRRDIRLMISDVVMPGMTGPELAARVRERHPQVGILFVTGYAGEAGEGDKLEGQQVLRKPFTVAALERAVGDALALARDKAA
jgi:signal transduction histidine kinase/ActR/RegA family two-component response regulator